MAVNHVRRRWGSGALLALVSLVLVVGVELVGVFSGLDAILRSRYEGVGGELTESLDVRDFFGMVLAALWCFGMSAMVFQCEGTVKRVVLGVSGLFLAAGLSPSFAVWGIYWAPFPLLLGAGWAWASAFIYVKGHPVRQDHGNVIHLAAPERKRVAQEKQN